MLVLARKINESIIINGSVEVVIIDIKGDQIKLGINAPRDIKIYRKEVYEEIEKQNKAAMSEAAVNLNTLSGLFQKDNTNASTNANNIRGAVKKIENQNQNKKE